MWGYDGGYGFGGFWHLILGIFFGVGQVLAILVFLGVLFLLVRFLLVATRAAHVYIAKNAPAAKPVPPAATKPAAAARPTTTTRKTPKPPTK